MVAIHEAFYQFAAGLVRGRVLDAASGTGFGTCLLAPSSRHVVGIDIKDRLVRYALDRYRAANLAFVVMDATRMAWADHSFDVVVADELLEHLPEHRPFLDEAVRVLAEDGLFLCATVNRAHTFTGPRGPMNRNHFREYDAADFRAELERYFEEVDLLGQGMSEDFDRYLRNPAARRIERLLVRLNVKHRISPAWRARVRGWISRSGVEETTPSKKPVPPALRERADVTHGLSL